MPRTPRIGKTRSRAALAAVLACACHYFSPHHPDAQGYTPLMRAAEAGDVAEIQRLLERGAAPDLRGADGTALLMAAEAGHAGAVSALLAGGADPKQRDPEGPGVRRHALRLRSSPTSLLGAETDISTLR